MKYLNYSKIVILALLFFLVSSVGCIYALEEDGVYIVKSVANSKNQIALTFDDGPHPSETLKILDILDKYNVKATFFVVGKHVNWYPKSVIEASERGHEIGNHTYTHPNINSLSKKAIIDEIKSCEEVILEKTGKRPAVFRPPFGNFDKDMMEEVSRETGYTTILWSSVDVKDWQNPSPELMSRQIIENTKSGDIVLLHDYSTESTVKSLETIIPSLIQRGYQFVTVSELLQNNKK